MNPQIEKLIRSASDKMAIVDGYVAVMGDFPEDTFESLLEIKRIIEDVSEIYYNENKGGAD